MKALPLYLQSMMDLDRRARDHLGIEDQVDWSYEERPADLGMAPEPLFPFPGKPFLSMGCLQWKDIELPEVLDKNAKQASRRSTMKDVIFERTRVWERIRSAALKCRGAPLRLDGVRRFPPRVERPSYAVV
jgi:hypothetical protein